MCVIIDPQSVYMWGYNKYGHLGLGSKLDQNLPQKLKLPDISAVKCGYMNSIALTKNGVYVWGATICEKLKIPKDDVLLEPYKISTLQNVQKIEAFRFRGEFGFTIGNKMYYTNDNVLYSKLNVKQIKMGCQCVIILTTEGRIYSKGVNHHGQLGLGHNMDVTQFQEIPSFRARKIDHTIGFTLALTASDELYVWGMNTFGQLGLGDVKHRNSPQKLVFPSKSPVISFCCGKIHAMVLLESHDVYVWGGNEVGQLGLGDTNSRLRPQKLNLSRVLRIYCGAYHSVALTTEGLYVWGGNEFGQLGLGDNQDRHVPTKLTFEF